MGILNKMLNWITASKKTTGGDEVEVVVDPTTVQSDFDSSYISLSQFAKAHGIGLRELSIRIKSRGLNCLLIECHSGVIKLLAKNTSVYELIMTELPNSSIKEAVLLTNMLRGKLKREYIAASEISDVTGLATSSLRNQLFALNAIKIQVGPKGRFTLYSRKDPAIIKLLSEVG